METKDSHNGEAPGQNKEFTIIVNAREKKWTEKKISFEQIIVLAYGIYEGDASIAYTVTYSRGEEKKPEGSMVFGDTVPVKDKMRFNVSKTNKS